MIPAMIITAIIPIPIQLIILIRVTMIYSSHFVLNKSCLLLKNITLKDASSASSDEKIPAQFIHSD